MKNHKFMEIIGMEQTLDIYRYYDNYLSSMLYTHSLPNYFPKNFLCTSC